MMTHGPTQCGVRCTRRVASADIRRGLAWGLVLLLLCADATPTMADGKIFARVVAVSSVVTTPDQRALVHFSNRIERLVIETSFVGEGTNFAWVVPLPSAPTIEAVSTNFFRRLTPAYQPKVVHEVSWMWAFFLFIGFIAASVVYARRRRVTPGCILLLLVALFLLALAIPNFVRARSTAMSTTTSGSTPDVLNLETVGVYDTVTLAGRDGRGIIDWLNTNGFQTPAAALPVISSYATQGWVFAAATLSRPSGGKARGNPHPLAFTFPTEKAVYPLRLTGVENERCQIELFVFGPERAEASGFRAEYCGEPTEIEGVIDTVDQSFFGPPRPGSYTFHDQEIRRRAFPAAVTTKLTGDLRAADLQADAWLSWVPFRAAHPTVHSAEAALGASLDWAIGLGVLGLVLVYALAPRLKKEIAARAVLAVLAVAASSGLIRLGTLSIAEVITIWSGRSPVNTWRQLDGALEQYALERGYDAEKVPNDPGEFLKELGSYFKGGTVLNPFDESPVRPQPSSGNLTLLKTTNGLDVLWYDYHGAAHRMITFTNKSR